METNQPKGTPTPVSIPDEQEFEEYLEWTSEEEEAFLRILEETDKDM